MSEKATELEKVIAVWPTLPESVKKSVVFMVNQFTG
jgi:hypothetical protein